MIYGFVTLILTAVFFMAYKLLLANTNTFSDFKLVNKELSTLNLNSPAFIYIVFSVFIAFLSLYYFNNLIIIMGILVVIIALPFFYKRYIKKRKINLFEKQLPDAIDLMAGSLIAGNSLTGAFFLIAQEFPPPLSDEISIVVREQKLGVSVDASLQNFMNRMPLNSVILTVSVIRTAAETGGELSDALKNVAKTLRSIEQAEGKIKALTSQGKMQAWVVGAMPVFLIIVLSKMEPEVMAKLWTTSEGYIALIAIVIFEFLGIIFIRKIVNIDV